MHWLIRSSEPKHIVNKFSFRLKISVQGVSILNFFFQPWKIMIELGIYLKNHERFGLDGMILRHKEKQ